MAFLTQNGAAGATITAAYHATVCTFFCVTMNHTTQSVHTDRADVHARRGAIMKLYAPPNCRQTTRILLCGVRDASSISNLFRARYLDMTFYSSHVKAN